VTLEEIQNLKFRIDFHKDVLHERELVTAGVISDAFGILLEREANQMFINTWLKTIDNEIDHIIQILEEIEADLTN
jgi:hypothetical protein